MEANDDRARRLRALGWETSGVNGLEGTVERHPYGAVAGALAVGYVLGGGLFSRLTLQVLGHGLRLGVKLVVMPIVAEHFLAMAEASPSSTSAEVTPAPHNGRT